eukprot:4873365-Pleurochrysis_carterae.AAC.2
MRGAQHASVRCARPAPRACHVLRARCSAPFSFSRREERERRWMCVRERLGGGATRRGVARRERARVGAHRRRSTRRSCPFAWLGRGGARSARGTAHRDERSKRAEGWAMAL